MPTLNRLHRNVTGGADTSRQESPAMRDVLISIVVVCVVLAGPGLRTASAQMDAGSLRVLVLDPSAGVMPGATVTLTNAATGAARTATSDGEGYVSFTPLPRGTYNLLTAIDGFQSHELLGVTV